MLPTMRDYATKKALGPAFNVQLAYVLEGYFDQDPTLPKEWRRLTSRIYKLKGAALNEAKFQIGREKALKQIGDPYRRIPARYSEIRVTEYVYVLDRSSVIETLTLAFNAKRKLHKHLDKRTRIRVR